MDLSLVPHLELIHELHKRADTLILFYGKKDEDQATAPDDIYGKGFNPDTCLKTQESGEGNQDIVFAYALLGNYISQDLSKRGLSQEDLVTLSAGAENALNEMADIDDELGKEE